MSTVFCTDEPRKIREQRKALGLTRKQLAEKSGCSESLIFQVENCLKWQSVHRLAILLALGLPTAYAR